MKDKNELEVFSSMPVPRAVFLNAIPAILAMLMVLIYNLADVFFIGKTHDPMQVAAISLASQVFVIYSALGAVFGIGGTSVISRALGAGMNEYAKKVSAFCMWGSVFVGIVFSVLMWIFMNPLLGILGANSETWDFTKNYLTIVALSGPFAVINGCYSNVLRAEGQSNKAMMGQILGNLTNIILDPIMISVLGLNTKGAGIATAIGNVVGTLYYIFYFMRGKSMLSIHIKNFSVKNKICSGVLAIGIPAALNTLLMSVSHIILNREISFYGNLQLAGIGVATNITKIPGLISIGLGQGIQPLIGYCAGAGDQKRCKKVIRFSLLFGIILSSVMTICAYIFINQLIGAFLSDEAAFGYGVQFTSIMLITSFLYGVFYVLTNVVQGFGEAKASLLINISRQGIIYIPVLFILQAIMGMNGLIWTQAVSDVISIILVVVIFAISYRKAMCQGTNQIFRKEVIEERTHIQGESKTNYIITIGRSFGAGGRSLGKGLAEKLNIPYYDKEIIEEAAIQSGLSETYLEKRDEKDVKDMSASEGYILIEKAVYKAQRQAILKIAAKGPCVIVGRHAECILKDTYKVFRVFVTAPLSSRIKRVSERDNISVDEASRIISKVDNERAEYYNSFSETKWGDAQSYDMVVNTDCFGIEGAKKLILDAL